MQFSRRGVAVGSLAPSLVCGCVEGGSAFDLSASQRDLSAISEEEAHSISMRSQCAIASPSILSWAARAQRPKARSQTWRDVRAIDGPPLRDPCS